MSRSSEANDNPGASDLPDGARSARLAGSRCAAPCISWTAIRWHPSWRIPDSAFDVAARACRARHAFSISWFWTWQVL